MTYAVYNYQSGSTQANVLADLIKILTGTTNKALLSANCVQANTSIIATVAAGWTVHDAAAGTNLQAIKALNQDATTYGYLGVGLSSATVSGFTNYESWNAGTHVATNACTISNSVWDASGGGYFYIYVTSKNIFLFSWTTAGYQTGMHISELSRDTIPAGYPCRLSGLVNFLANASGPSGKIPRIKNNATTGDATNASATLTPLMGWTNVTGTTGGGYTPITSNQVFRDAAETTYAAIYKGASGLYNNNNNIHLGTTYDVLLSGNLLGSNLDEITYGGTTYVIFALGYCTVLLPKA